ncbi:MAG: flagellar biosynthesis protein FlhA [Desulfobacterales bacterium]|nr:flagellar biosynthesis protein FlhA [Desulfobacterales bacterium]
MATQAIAQRKFTDIFKNAADIGMVLAVIGILMAMILPIPGGLLDFLLALNILMSIIVLITAMYTLSPVDFAIFPSLLLVLTLFRLSLNVATTRLILVHGNEGISAAGNIIQAFGSFVVGGNYVIGLIIFVILVLINFMVITKGSGRIAEVAARFTLDAMPGKQMAIDADLNAGIIDEAEAKKRRKDVARESEYFGAMDGASKFVKGDAVAGILITFINVIGGFIIGVFQKDLTMLVAAQNYTLLTIGDGLVAQIPALIISTAAGLLVSRSGAENKMGEEFKKHLTSNPDPIYMGSAIVFLIGFVPGFPALPFMGLSLLIGGVTFFFQTRGQTPSERAKEEAKEEGAKEGPEEVEHLLTIDDMELEVGYGIIPLVDKEQDGNLLGRIKSIRRQFVTDMGIIIPPIHIRDNLKLKPSEYRVLIKGSEMARNELMLNHLLAMDPGTVTHPLEGVPTTEPAFNLPAIWIPMEKEEEAKFAGYTVVDNSTIIATHLTEVIRANSSELIGRQEVQHLLDNLAKTNPKAVEELIPNLIPLGSLQKVLRNLLNERVSIRDLITIVETLADFATMSKDPDLLTEYVRQKLSRSIVSPLVLPDGILPVITIDPKLEEMLNRGIQQTAQGTYFSVDPAVGEAVMASIMKEAEKATNQNFHPVILCSSNLRRHFRKLVEQIAPSVTVISHAEIIQNIRIQAIGKVVLKYGS